MIRFTYAIAEDDLDPKGPPPAVLTGGGQTSPYSYLPREDVWTLVIPDVEEGVRVRQGMDRLDIDYDEAVVTSRFE